MSSRTCSLLLCLLGLLSIPTVSLAQSMELTPFAAIRMGGDFDDIDTGESYELDEATSLGLLFDWDLDAQRQVEVIYSRQETDLTVQDSMGAFAPLDLNVSYLQGGGTYLFDGERARPYIAGTIGLTHFDPQESAFDSETRISFSLGGGIKLFPTEHIGLRFEGRGYFTFFDSSGQAFCSGGCTVRLKSSAFTQFEAFAGIIVRIPR